MTRLHLRPHIHSSLREALVAARGELGAEEFAQRTGLRRRAIEQAESHVLRRIDANVVAAYHHVSGSSELLEILDPRSRQLVLAVLQRRGVRGRYVEDRVALTAAAAAMVGAAFRRERETQRVTVDQLSDMAYRRRELDEFERGRLARPAAATLTRALRQLDVAADEVLWQLGIEAFEVRRLDDRIWIGDRVGRDVIASIGAAYDATVGTASDVAYLARVPLSVVSKLDHPDVPLSARSAARLGVALGLHHDDLSSGVPEIDSQTLSFGIAWRSHPEYRRRIRVLGATARTMSRDDRRSGL